MDDLTKEFIAESQEGLDRMERCLTELETRPDDTGLLGEIFRSVHTIKGTTGFLGFDRLEKLAHVNRVIITPIASFPWNIIVQVVVNLLLGVVSPSVWALSGSSLRSFMTSPRAVRAFNVVMAALLLASLDPVFMDP